MILFLNFSKISICLIKSFSFFIKNEIRLYPSKFISNIVICEWNVHKFFQNLGINEIFKNFVYQKKAFRYYYYINICIVYWNSAFILVSSNFIIFLFIFKYGFKYVYIFFNSKFSAFFHLNQLFKAHFYSN